MMNSTSINGHTSINRKRRKEPVTPYKIALLSFISEFCNTKHFQEENALSVPSDASLLSFSIAQRKNFCIFVLRAVKNLHMTWQDFCTAITEKDLQLPSSFITKYVAAFRQLVSDGVAGILSLAESCANLVRASDEQPLVGRTSIVGFFCRKMWLRLEELSFEESIELNKELGVYFSNYETRTSLNEVPQCSPKLFVHQQQLFLQRNEIKAMDYLSLNSAILKLVKETTDFPEAYHLLYGNSARAMNFTDAEQYLHHAFDQTSNVTTLTNCLQIPDERAVSKLFGTAVLNLALLHSSLGHWKENLSALKEAIQKFEDSGDILLLQQSLAWLCKLNSKHYSQKRLRMLETLIKSNERNPQHLVSYGIQMWIHEVLASTIEPRDVFGYLHASDVKNFQRSYNNLALSGLVLRAALYKFYGYSLNACLASQLALSLQTQDSTKGNTPYDNENTLAAFASLANHLGRSGLYQELDSLLQYMKERYSSMQRYSKIWMSIKLHWDFYRFLWMGSFDEALRAANELVHLDQFDGLCKLAEAQLLRGGYEEASDILQTLKTALDAVTEENDPNSLQFRVRYLLLMAVVFNTRGAQEIAVEKLIEAAGMCQRHKMFHLGVLVKLQTAELQLNLGLENAALKQVDASLDVIWTSSSVYEQGLALFLKSKCILACAEKNAESRKMALQLLGNAKTCFEKVDAFYFLKDALHLEMLVLHSLGERKKRNLCALEYRQLEDRYPTLMAPNLVIFAGL